MAKLAPSPISVTALTIRQGESKKIKEERLVNHVMDLRTIAVATFFDGFKTHDDMPRESISRPSTSSARSVPM